MRRFSDESSSAAQNWIIQENIKTRLDNFDVAVVSNLSETKYFHMFPSLKLQEKKGILIF